MLELHELDTTEAYVMTVAVLGETAMTDRFGGRATSVHQPGPSQVTLGPLYGVRRLTSSFVRASRRVRSCAAPSSSEGR